MQHDITKAIADLEESTFTVTKVVVHVQSSNDSTIVFEIQDDGQLITTEADADAAEIEAAGDAIARNELGVQTIRVPVGDRLFKTWVKDNRVLFIENDGQLPAIDRAIGDEVRRYVAELQWSGRA